MRSARPISICLACLFLTTTACHDGSGRHHLAATLDGFEVVVEADPPALIIGDGQQDLLVLSPDELTGGLAVRHAEATYEMQVGSFKIQETDADTWRPVKSFGSLSRDGEAVLFDLLDGQAESLGTASLRPAGTGHMVLHFQARQATVNRMSISFGCLPDEHFLGFGGQSFDVDHRGQTIPIWVQEDGITKAETDEYDPLWFVNGRRHSTHTPMPIYLSSRGYALALESDHRSLFHMASEVPTSVRVESWHGELRLHLFAGQGPPAVIEHLTAWTGRPALPPAFTFAPWLDAMYGSANVRRVADRLRSEGVPASVIWTEDWRGAIAAGETYTLEEDWHVDRGLYPDFEALADDLHASGFKFLTYNNTFLLSSADIWDTAVAAGYAIQDPDGGTYVFTGATFEDTSLLDLTNPEARAWAKGIYRQGLELGADGYMADFAEWLPTDAVLASGESAVAHHNRYPVAYQELNKELLDELRAEDGIERLFFVRSAYLGSQPLVSVVWAGDQQTDFSRGDGLPSIVPIGIGLGLTGFPFYGHDIGGYMSSQTEPTTKELWFRWVTLGALSPVMRTHHGRSAQANWNWESDDESVAHLRFWASLHIRLLPYLQGLARDAVERGAPLFRPLAFDHPEFDAGWILTDQFMLGDRIVVAPVVTQGATERQVALPPGTWYPLLGGGGLDVAEGDARTVAASPSEIPAFVPAGAMLVLLPEGIQTLVAAEPVADVVGLADVGDDRDLWLWPGGRSEWREAGGLTYTWEATDLDAPVDQVTWNDQAMTLDGAEVELRGNGTMSVNGQASLTIEGGAGQRTLRVRFPAQSVALTPQ